jgi:hypothetical protein
MANRHRDRDGLLSLFVPQVVMNVGAASPDVAGADQNVMDPDLRVLEILEPQTALGLALDPLYGT